MSDSLKTDGGGGGEGGNISTRLSGFYIRFHYMF